MFKDYITVIDLQGPQRTKMSLRYLHGGHLQMSVSGAFSGILMKIRSQLAVQSTHNKLVIMFYRALRISAIYLLNIFLVLQRGKWKILWIPEKLEFELITNPLVSIILPTYNHGTFLKSAIESIREQDYLNLELIIINDGSTDDSDQILRNLSSDSRIIIINQENQGLPNSLNNGFKVANGDFLTWTSADNVLAPDCISKLITAANENSNIGLVYSDFQAIDEIGNQISGGNPWRIYDRDKNTKSVIRLKQPHMMYKSIPINYVGPYFLYRAQLAQILTRYANVPGLEDWEFWLRMQLITNFKHFATDGLRYQYRVHANSMSSHLGVANNLVMTIKVAAKIVKRIVDSKTIDEALNPEIAEEVYSKLYPKLHRPTS